MHKQLELFKTSKYSRIHKFLNTPSWAWTEKELGQLKLEELLTLKAVMGIRGGKSKAEVVIRLMNAGRVREAIQELENDSPREKIEEFAKVHKGNFLSLLCKVAGCYNSSTKYGKVVSLLNWRRRCMQNWLNTKEQLRENFRKAKEELC